MELMLSAIKPTGDLTLGNYIGAIKNFVKLQDDYNLFVFVADLHALTVRNNKEDLNRWIKEVAAIYIACGLDPNKATIFNQSDLPQHAYLGYILTCESYMGELSRMTQFKDKSARGNNESIGVGLFIYPTLMAADILLYDAKYVPVGEDQTQHVELTRDLASRFNHYYGETFVIPKAIVAEKGARIMALDDPLKKMSKSELGDNKGSIRLLDDVKTIRKKIMSAVTDSDNLVKYDIENKPGISNLMTIYSSLTNKSYDEIEDEFRDGGYGNFKKAVADVVVEEVSKIQVKFNEIIKGDYLDKVLKEGALKAGAIASKKIDEVKRKLGLII
ncbi:TPA: tryptophan--tRNA ligase [bacterium]|nr:tryptophan--tRNA ligase [bacterium]